MNYKLIYESLINRAKQRELEGYKERHHILPKCLGGDDSEGNLVDLTPEEHYVCHQLLLKMYPGESKLVYAAKMMTITRGDCPRSNKLYGWLRRRFVKMRKSGGYKTCMCGEKFYCNKGELKRGRKWCSAKCRNKNETQKTGKDVTCPCGKEFYVQKHALKKINTCSKKCKSKYHHLIVGYGGKTKTCDCGKEFYVRKSMQHQQYCSRDCMYTFHTRWSKS